MFMPRFQKGQSGNPKGRPRGAKGLANQFLEEVNRLHEGEPVSRLEAAIKKQVDGAVGGDLRAIQLVLNRVEAIEEKLSQAADDTYPFTDADREAISEIHRRLAGGEETEDAG
jgi:hypothetical protein